MLLESLGFGPFASAFSSLSSELVPARIVSPLGTRFLIAGASVASAELSGRLRHELIDEQRPTVGDWVAVAIAGDLAIIHAVIPRRTALIRTAAGRRGEPQVVAANVDTFFVVTSANRDANERRLERYLAAIADSGAAAVIVVNKLDLCEDLSLLDELASLGVPVLGVSAATGDGLDALAARIPSGHTAAFVGMSGVGKSSLVNRLLAVERQSVLPIDDNDRGRHSTTRRELIAIPGGGIVIDTPGMRSFGLADDEGGLASTFSDVEAFATQCRFRDCKHDGEPGCAVVAAIEDGELDPERLEASMKLQREAHGKRRMKAINRALRAHYKLDPKRSR